MARSSATVRPVASGAVDTLPTLHDRKQQLVRTSLAGLALPPLLARGFDAVTIDQLASAAGISRRTFFRYFASKEEVVTCTFDDAGATMLARFARSPRSEPPLEALQTTLRSVIDAFRIDPSRAQATLQLIRTTPALRARFLVQQDDWADRLTASIQSRLPRNGRTPMLARLTARVAIAAIDAAMTAWGEQDGRTLEAIVDEAFDALHGLIDTRSTKQTKHAPAPGRRATRKGTTP